MSSILFFFFFFAVWNASLILAVEFINPLPAGKNGDYSQNPSYVFGSTAPIQWSAIQSGTSVTLVLYQDRPGDQFEYVLHDISNTVNQLPWEVQTTKLLSNGNVFFFQIFLNDSTIPTAQSHYFNITAPANKAIISTTLTPSQVTTSTTWQPSTTASPSTSTTTLKTPSSSISTSTATSSNTPPATSPPHTGASSSAKLGLGLGIPIAIIAGLSLGWLIFGRRQQPPPQQPAIESTPLQRQPVYKRPISHKWYRLDAENQQVYSVHELPVYYTSATPKP